MAKGISLVRVAAAVLLLSGLGACSATYVDHGYVPAPSEVSQVKAGETKAEVVKQIGSPSLKGLQGDNSWYYIQSRWRHFGPFKPREVKRQVVAVSFNASDRVTKVEQFGKERGLPVAISERETASTVRGETLLQQLFRDLGRFNPAALFGNNGG